MSGSCGQPHGLEARSFAAGWTPRPDNATGLGQDSGPGYPDEVFGGHSRPNVGNGVMERRTRRNHFSSAALSITDDLAHRSILLLRATCGLMHRSKRRRYSITSSVRASSIGGTVSPSAFAVLRLI